MKVTKDEAIFAVIGAIIFGFVIFVLYHKVMFLIANPTCLWVECRQVVEVPK